MEVVLVVGIGNTDRGDDGAGPETIRFLRESGPEGVSYLTHSGEPTSLLDLFDQADMLFLVDAVQSGGLPGEMVRISVDSEALPDYFHSVSSHGLGLGEAIEFARTLDRLPERVVVFGIEGVFFDAGCALSPEVKLGSEKAATCIRKELLEVLNGEQHA